MRGGKPGSARRWILFAVVLLLLLGSVLPPLININRYQHRIVENISRSIGRQVHISSVKLRLLPLPGFEFSDFSIEEDPRFGAEPFLHSGSVDADLRLLSLWRGRLEVSRIHFDEASLNLVRQGGEWNVASILLQAAQIPNAPTAQRHASSAPRFPYIEAENSRVNFKQGNEKLPLSFLNSDLSISLDPGDEWELHFRAQPVRTDLDLDLADTGTLRIDGALHRAALLDQMPLRLNMEWSGAPLGQLSRLALGHDAGWRGALDVQTEVRGAAALARIDTRLRVDGLHRAEFTPPHPLDLTTSCHALFRKESSALEDISCASPVGDGALRLTGSVEQVQNTPKPDLTLSLERVPASALLAGLQAVRNGLAPGVQAAGTVNGRFAYSSTGDGPPALSGEMGLDSLSLSSSDADKSMVLAPVRLRCETAPVNRSTVLPALLLQPVRAAMGGPAPVIVDGRFTSAGFDLHLSGPASLARLQPFARSLGLLGAGSVSTALGGAGAASLDLGVQGSWVLPVPDLDHPAATSTVEGSIALKNAELTASYLSQPLRILSAQAVLGPAQISWNKASIAYGKLEAQGSLEYPTRCSTPEPCPIRFALVSPALDLGTLQSALLGTSGGPELLREILDRIDRRSARWPALSGTVAVAVLSAGKLVLHDVNGAVNISGDSIRIPSLNGSLANGAMHLTGVVDASGDQPDYGLDVQVTNASAGALAAIFQERWGSGLINLSAQLKLSGFGAVELAQSAQGTLRWDWTKGGLAGLEPQPAAAQPLLHFDQWTAVAVVGDRSIQVTHGLLARGAQAIPLSGTISFDRELDLRGGSGGRAFAISGTLERPVVQAIPAEVEN